MSDSDRKARMEKELEAQLRRKLAPCRRSESVLRETGTGQVIEYRRVFVKNARAIIVEFRPLGPGARPVGDQWFFVETAHWGFCVKIALT